MVEFSNLPRKLAGTALIALFLGGCVNDATTETLKPVATATSDASQEERFVAKKCVSSDRLQASNQASGALNAKFLAFSQKQDQIAKDKQPKIVEQLQGEGAVMESLDGRLKQTCTAYSACEYRASLDKRSCDSEKGKFDEVRREIATFTKKVNSISF